MKAFVRYLGRQYKCLFEPASENNLLLMQLGESVAKWVAGVGGVTLVVAISFSASAYTSFIQIPEKCQSRLIASDAILAGRIFALWAISGAGLALVGMAWPHILKQLWYGTRVIKARQDKSLPPDLDKWHPATIAAKIPVVLIFTGFCSVAAVPLAALSGFAR